MPQQQQFKLLYPMEQGKQNYNMSSNGDDDEGSNSDHNPYDKIYYWRIIDTESHRKAHDSTGGDGVTELRIILSRIDYHRFDIRVVEGERDSRQLGPKTEILNCPFPKLGIWMQECERHKRDRIQCPRSIPQDTEHLEVTNLDS